MRPKITFLLLGIALPFVGAAQTKLHLDFESPDLHRVWIGTGTPSGEPVEFKAENADLPMDPAITKPMVWVENERTGNLASHDVPSLAGKWTLKEGDYIHVGRVVVRVESKGQPVASAAVSVKGPGLDRQGLLTPGDKGELSFIDVSPGTLSLTVKYKVSGKDADPIKQAFELSLKRDKPEPTLIVSIPDAVDVVAAPPSASPSGTVATAPASAPPTAVPASGGSTIGSILTFLIVLGLVGGGCYYVLVVMKKNGDTVQDKLRQLGVDIPKPADDTGVAGSVVPITPVRAAGPPDKIMLGDAPPDPLAQLTPPISLSGTPTLRMPNGDVYELPEGETIVGRDLGLGLSLVNETTVSRRHVSIIRAGSDVRVKDLGSSNGTFINGQRLSGEAPVSPGDLVQFGAVQCRLEG